MQGLSEHNDYDSQNILWIFLILKLISNIPFLTNCLSSSSFSICEKWLPQLKLASTTESCIRYQNSINRKCHSRQKSGIHSIKLHSQPKMASTTESDIHSQSWHAQQKVTFTVKTSINITTESHIHSQSWHTQQKVASTTESGVHSQSWHTQQKQA